MTPRASPRAGKRDPGEAFGQVCAAIGRPLDRVNPELRTAVYELRPTT